MSWTDRADMPIKNDHYPQCPKRAYFIVGGCDMCGVIERVRKDTIDEIITIIIQEEDPIRMVQAGGYLRHLVADIRATIR